MKLRPGDVFLVRGSGLLGRLIRALTRRIGESRTKVSHVGIVTTEDGVVVEALSTVVRWPLLPRYQGATVAVYRPIGLSWAQLLAVTNKAESYVGRSYGWFKLGLHALDWLLQGAYVFRRLGRMDRYPICSYLVAHAFAVVRITFGVDPGAATPDDIWDYITTHRNEFGCVHPLGVLEP